MKYNNNRETILATKIVKPEKKTNKKFQAFGLKTVSFLGLFQCSQSGDYSKEDLARLSYKQDMNWSFLIILLYFWLHTEN